MGSGRLALFVTPDELRAKVDRIRTNERLSIISYYYPQPDVGQEGRVEVIPVERPFLDTPLPDQLFMGTAPQVVRLQGKDLGALAFAQGWIYIWPLPNDAEALHLCTVSFRSPKREAALLFRRMKRVFQEQMVRGVVITSAKAVSVDVDDRHIVNDIYYAKGALHFATQGIPWRQYGVSTQRFWPVFDATAV